MSETNPPPVAPVEGPLYLLFTEYENTTNIRKWSQEPFYGAQEYVPVGELERLRAALQKLHEGLAWDWRGHPVGDLPTLREIARTALQEDAP